MMDSHDGHDHESAGNFIDITTYGTFHGSSSHTDHGELAGGRTPITTEAMVTYNGLRNFLGLDAVAQEVVGQWAFDEALTNNTQAYGEDLLGVGLWYAMQGAKVGWIRDDAFDPQILADIQREARLGDPAVVMTMVETYGHEGFADYLMDQGLFQHFLNTLKMEPHYGGWMHGRTHGFLALPEGAIAHDVNHLTVLSHDQTQPFMNDTFDWPQWPALDVPEQDVIDYFQAMVVLGDPLGDALPTGTVGDPVDPDPAAPIAVTVTGGTVTEADPGMDHVHSDGTTHVHDDGHRYITFTVSLDAPAAEEIALTYATADGTAIADTTSDVAWDYHEAIGTLVFAPGEQTKTVVVAVHPDTLVEGTETFTLSVTGENATGMLEATGTIYDNDGDAPEDDDGDAGSSGPFVGGGQTYTVGQTTVVTGFDPARDVLDLGPGSIHTQIPVDTPAGLMMMNMFNASQSLLVEGVHLADLHPENFAPIADAHLQQDLSAILAYEDGSGLVRPNTVYARSHEQGLEEIVDFDPATDKVSFFYLSVRGDGQLNFAVEDTAEGARFYSPLTGQSLTLRGVSFSDLDSSHFEWRANQLEDGIAGRMGLEAVIDGFTYPSENIFSGKSVAMAGLVDRAPYHSGQGYEDYTGTPIGGGSDGGNSGGGGDDGSGDTGGGDDGSGYGGDSGDPFTGEYTFALDDWGGGFVARFNFIPETTVNGWTAQIATEATITNIWNAEIVSHENGILTIRNAGYNASPAAGQSFEVGFQGEGSSAGLELLDTTLPLPADDTVSDGDGLGDTTQGGDGVDTLSFAWLEEPTSTFGTSEFGVFADLSLQSSEQDTGAGVFNFSGFENLEGSDFADVLSGDGTANTVTGLAGSDLLFGGDADDVLFGGDGYDALEGGEGADELYGGTNTDGGPEGDIVTYFNAAGPLVFHFGMSLQEFEETSSQDLRDDFIGEDIEGVAGASSFSNTFIADQITGTTFLLGGGEADTFVGGSVNRPWFSGELEVQKSGGFLVSA